MNTQAITQTGLDKYKYQVPDQLPYLQTNPVGPETKGESFSKWLTANSQNLKTSVPGIALNTQNLLSSIGSSNSSTKTMNIADSGVGTVSSIASMFGPQGQAVGAAINAINSIGGSLIGTPKSIKNFDINKNIGSGFGGTIGQATQLKGAANTYSSSGLAGKLFGGAGLKKKIQESNIRQSAASDLSNLGQQQMNAAAQSQDMFALNQSKKNNGSLYGTGAQPTIGRKGMVLQKKTEKFQNGGQTKSVIVNGALHARKHDLMNLDEFKNAEITGKGVPVISKGEGGEISQECEVEKNELILTKDITDKLNELFEKNDEESQIEAGKILAYEIMKNTVDSKDKIIKTA